ncbi:hypothetical protein V8F06_010756 [Rhypophila decipiens]
MDQRYYAGRKPSSEASPAGEERQRLRKLDERSMDETALLAFAILLEEAGRSSLGKTGDLVFVETEGEEFDSDQVVPRQPLLSGPEPDERNRPAEGEEEAFDSDQVLPRQPPLGGPEPAEHNRPPSRSREVESMPVEPEEERRPKKKRRRNLSGHCWADPSINDA